MLFFVFVKRKISIFFFFFSSRRRHTRLQGDWSSDVCSSDLAGWEKGQVENQVGHVREQVFTPRLKAADLAELNALLERRCLEIAKRLAHPEQRERTRWAVYEAEERAALLPLPAAPYDGFAERECRVSSTALVHYDRNRYSVDCRWAGKTVSVRAYAERIVMVADGAIVGEHLRSFERERTFPFRDWP